MINSVHKIGQTHIKDIAANAAKILMCLANSDIIM